MNAPMLHAMTPPLAPFVDALPLPSRLIALRHQRERAVGGGGEYLVDEAVVETHLAGEVVEAGIGHTQKTPLHGQRFESLAQAQAYLDRWETHWADTRIHGTTKRQVAAMFAEERPTLQPLPVEPFRYYRFGVRTVHLDGCVEVEAAYYSTPPGWIGQRVQVQWTDLHVRLLDPKGPDGKPVKPEDAVDHRKQQRAHCAHRLNVATYSPARQERIYPRIHRLSPVFFSPARSFRTAKISSIVKPGPSVAISKRTPPGSRK